MPAPTGAANKRTRGPPACCEVPANSIKTALSPDEVFARASEAASRRGGETSRHAGQSVHGVAGGGGRRVGGVAAIAPNPGAGGLADLVPGVPEVARRRSHVAGTGGVGPHRRGLAAKASGGEAAPIL
eukprot:CAMPEP_0170307986 /NCGR_PEP_ID=MMETSP0116_2-20130129/54423_1 /TAXON_ID=400756 /ORGANISM="Durinskia baltica, Strain CSIRO CS-38" /LENGTH=127 /DNA_ID=CAMNT_0010560149 /DNA_START=119 /DNA_END=499 /DNA_ORIENTATION=-